MDKTQMPTVAERMTTARPERQPDGVAGRLLSAAAIAWSLFQSWHASPLPFVLDDIGMRAIHLGVALFLGLLACPAFKSSSRASIPIADWILAVAGAVSGAYLFLVHHELALRPGQPTAVDMASGAIGLVVLLEATRRAVGVPMAVFALVFLAYTFAGAVLPEAISHKGVSLERAISYQWLTTEGVYGPALGVSAGYIFLYVLFGALLEKAGARNYVMQVSFALLGRLRGGAAKAAVVSSALNGVIPGAAVSDAGSGGVSSVALLKRSGFGDVKAAAIETSASVNARIMPPLMGAAALLMVEYLGIPYAEVIKHAFLPATICCVTLFFIVHLEAAKLDVDPVAPAARSSAWQALMVWLLGVSGTIMLCGGIYYAALGVKALFMVATPWEPALLLAALYVYCVSVSARCPDLPRAIELGPPASPDIGCTVMAGLHFLIPISVLIWCLTIAALSPAPAAFWATLALVVQMLTRQALIAWFRKDGSVTDALARGVREVVDGLELGGRRMVGIAIATAAAGIIAGTVALTDLELRLIDFIGALSMGNVLLMLGLAALACLVLGMGVPTVAHYVVAASLMAPVIAELGARAGLVIPLVAVHLFVFYFGIAGDIVPPAGRTSAAAAAIAGAGSVRTALQGSQYALLTLVLPFVFVFNPAMLMIDVESAGELLLVTLSSTLAACLFVAVTMNYFRTRCRWCELVVLGLAAFVLFRPDVFMDMYAPKYEDASASRLYEVAAGVPENGRLVLVIKGTTLEGKDTRKTVALQLGAAGEGAQRFADAGLTLFGPAEQLRIADVKPGSRAGKSGFEQGWDVEAIKVPAARPSEYWLYIPALLLIAGVWWKQGRRAGIESDRLSASRTLPNQIGPDVPRH